MIDDQRLWISFTFHSADDTNEAKNGAWREGGGRDFRNTSGRKGEDFSRTGATWKGEEKATTLGTPEILPAATLDAGQ